MHGARPEGKGAPVEGAALQRVQGRGAFSEGYSGAMGIQGRGIFRGEGFSGALQCAPVAADTRAHKNLKMIFNKKNRHTWHIGRGRSRYGDTFRYGAGLVQGCASTHPGANLRGVGAPDKP